RKDGVETGFGGAVVLAEPLDDLDLFLRHDLDRLHQHDETEQGEDEKNQAHARVTSRTMPSAPVTRMRVPMAIGVAERAAQSCPPTFTRPAPSVKSMSCVTIPS